MTESHISERLRGETMPFRDLRTTRRNELLHEAAGRIEKLEAALLRIKIYGNDTMSGPADGSEDNRNWYRGAVIVMKNHARKALEAKDD